MKWNMAGAARVGNLTRALVNMILPERCALCLAVDDGGYCLNCQSLLPWIEVACRCCGQSLAQPGICGSCQGRIRSHAWLERELVVPFRYGQPVARHIHQLKYEDRFHLAPGLAKMLAIAVLDQGVTLPEVILPVPLHPRRQRERGYNQATLIADEIGRLTGIPVDQRHLIRNRHTATQTDLTETERRRNMRNAFAVSPGRRYDAVAVVDDVVTSGATIDSVCQTLHRAGTSRIMVWALAKT